MGTLDVAGVAWNEASGELVSPRAKEIMGGIVRIKCMSLESHSTPIHVTTSTLTRRL